MTLEDLEQKMKTWFMFLNRYLREMAAWLFGPKFIWLLLIALAADILFLVYVPCLERGFRFFGMGLQLVGFVMVAWGLYQTSQLFRKPFLLKRIAQWWRKGPRFGPRHDTVTVSAAQLMLMPSNDIRVRDGVVPGSPLEARVEVLEQKHASLYDEVGSLKQSHSEKITDLLWRLDVEAAARQEADTRNEQRLDNAVAEDLHLEWIAFLLFVIGTIAGSTAPELSSMFGGEASCPAIEFRLPQFLHMR